MKEHHFLAFDLGASSGRAILGTIENFSLKLTEIHRFKNQMSYIQGSYFWNIFSLFDELKTGLKKCISEHQIQPESIGIDTWGVDYASLLLKATLPDCRLHTAITAPTMPWKNFSGYYRLKKPTFFREFNFCSLIHCSSCLRRSEKIIQV